MKTDWLFQEPIDFEHKQYVLLSYIQKLDKQLQNLKLYPNFQQVSLHLASLNLIIEKKQYLTLNRSLKTVDDEILISDLLSNNIPLFTNDQEFEINKICEYSNIIIKDYFNRSKALWEISNDSISINPIFNSKNINPKEGLFFIENNGNTHLYEFIIKKIKKGVVESKCVIKNICISKESDIENIIINVKSPLIKNINDINYRKKLIIFKVHHNDQFPFKETLLPISKRKIMNYMIQSKLIKINN
jgi:hypothetical protein